MRPAVFSFVTGDRAAIKVMTALCQTAFSPGRVRPAIFDGLARHRNVTWIMAGLRLDISRSGSF
jgi:hypothetical protein